MKYNSIGEQLIAKAQELDPNYKPDKFNDMSEALNIILNNSGGSSKYYEITITRILFDYESKSNTEKEQYCERATDYTLKFIIDEINFNNMLSNFSETLGITVNAEYLVNNYNVLKQNTTYVSGLIFYLLTNSFGSITSLTNRTDIAYINNCCYIAIPSIEGTDSWFKCVSGWYSTLFIYDVIKNRMAKIGWDGVAEDSTLTITTKYL